MNSALNPEAPVFFPDVKTAIEVGLTKLNKTIKSSNKLPVGTSLEIFKTFQDFNIVSCQMTRNLILQSNDIIKTELPEAKLQLYEDELNTEKVIDVNDRILDRINININYVSRGEEKPPEPEWSKPVLTKIQVGSAMFLGAKNIPRPQLSFKDPVDNSDKLWVPKISDKPNNIKPLALNILYNEEGEAIGYEHPYKVELELYEPPPGALEPDSEALQFPPALEDTSLTYIKTEDGMDQLVEYLTTVNEIAVDVEHHSYRTYQGITCLIQISTCDGDFLIDTLVIREHVHKLNLVFTDPKIIKVLHGAERDVVWLQRDFGLYIVGMVDTHQAARALTLPSLSLKSLLLRFCGVETNKQYQLADWRIRPLPDELRHYARTDTHYLLYVWKRLKADLLSMARDGSLLRSVFENSRQICSLTYNKKMMTDKSHLKLYLRSKKTFNSRQMAALRLLYRWRDSNARELDESTAYLLPNHMLMALAENLPREVQGVNALCNPMPPFLRQNLGTVHRMILSCRELPLEPPTYTNMNCLSAVTVAAVPVYSVLHDLTYLNYGEAEPRYPDTDVPNVESELPVFQAQEAPIVSDLNVDAKMFIPPYDRYRKYRVLAQVEEIKEYKDKEAKISAISKGNELIKTEVLLKLQEAKLLIENEGKEESKMLENNEEKKPENKPNESLDTIRVERHVIQTDGRRRLSKSPPPRRSAHRKRKMSHAEKVEKKQEIGNERDKQQQSKNKTEQKTANPYNYKKVNYKKFHDEVDRTHKQSKTKIKKQ